jgi:hypothetical protein
MTVFWDVATFSLVGVHRRFRCVYCLYHQVLMIRRCTSTALRRYIPESCHLHRFHLKMETVSSFRNAVLLINLVQMVMPSMYAILTHKIFCTRYLLICVVSFISCPCWEFAAQRRWLSSGTLFLVVVDIDRRCHYHSWNIGQFLPDYMAQHPRRQPSSYLSPWETDISPFNGIFISKQTSFSSNKFSTYYI